MSRVKRNWSFLILGLYLNYVCNALIIIKVIVTLRILWQRYNFAGRCSKWQREEERYAGYSVDLYQDVISFSIRPPKCNCGKFPRLKAILYRPSGYSEFLYRPDTEIEISENKVTGLPRALFVRLLPRFATCDRCAHLYLDYEKIVYRNLWTDYRGKSVGKDIWIYFRHL